MTTFSPTAAIQSDYLPTTDFPEFGARWRARQASDIYDSACGDMRVTTPGVLVLTVTNNVNAETWHFNYQGVVVPFVTGASTALTVAALNTALATVFGSGMVLAEEVASIVPVSPAVTINFAAGVVPSATPTITASAGGLTSTFTAVYSTTPTAAMDHEPGLWVAIDPVSYDPQVTSIKEPDSLTARPYGIALLEGAHAQLDEGGFGPVTSIWQGGRPMNVARHMEGGVIGKADGVLTAADVGALVYMVVSGVRKGWSRKDSGGVSQVTRGDFVGGYVAGVAQVTRGDVVFNGTDLVGLAVDSLADLTVASDTSDDITVAALALAWNDSGPHFAVATATTDISGAESWIILTFKDGGAAVHTVAAVSPATADVVTITNTTEPVAPVADATGLSVTGLSTLSIVPTNASDDVNVANFALAWNASAEHSAAAVATIDISGAESYILLTFRDFAAHTVVSYTPGVGDITGITNTVANTAASAVVTKSTFMQPANDAGKVAIAVLEG